MKVEIEKELANECYKNSTCFDEKGKQVDCLKDCAYVKNLSSSLTSLIIKWLESKKLKLINENNPMLTDNPFENSLRELRNQLLIELIGELK